MMQAVSPTADRASYSGHDGTWLQSQESL